MQHKNAPTTPPGSRTLPAGDFKLTCRRCGKTFVWHRPAGASRFLAKIFPTICYLCAPAVTEERQAEADPHADAVAYWQGITPPLYLDSDPDKLPLVKAARTVLDWQYGPTGILAHGDPKLGKTRSMFLLLKRLCLEGHRPATFNAVGFAQECADQFRSERSGRKWIKRLTMVDTLLLDDLGKEKLTETVESNLFALIRGRIEQMRPTLITTNFTGAVMLKTWTRDRAESLLARLRDPAFFQVVPFT